MENPLSLLRKTEMKPGTAREWEDAHLKHAEEEFTHHDVYEQPYGWSFSRRNVSFHSGEIVLCAFSCILIHGDLPSVMYQGGHYPEPKQRLSWLAAGNLDYVAGKVQLGKKETFVHEVALLQAQEYFDSFKAEGKTPFDNCYCPFDPNEYDLLVEMIKDRDDDHKIREHLYEISDNDAEMVADFGMATDTDVIWTYAAARHVWEVVKNNGCRKR